MRLPILLLVASSLTFLVAGCKEEETTAVDGTMKADGYALFAVDNEREQRNDVTITIRDVDPKATYVLFYSKKAPTNVGWFLFDPATRTKCGASVGTGCEVSGVGYMVDVVKAEEGMKEVTLRDSRCEQGDCDDDDHRRNDAWLGHWAVLRVERTNRTHPITIQVRARDEHSFADEPKVEQWQ